MAAPSLLTSDRSSLMQRTVTDPTSLYHSWSQAADASLDNIPELPGLSAGPPFFMPAEFDNDPLNKNSTADMFGLANSSGSAGFAAYDCVSRVLEDDEQSIVDGTFSAGASFNAGSSFNSSSFSATIRPPVKHANSGDIFSFDRFVILSVSFLMIKQYCVC